MAQHVSDMVGPTNDPEIRNAVWAAAAGKCLRCGQGLLPSTGDPASLHVDHVVPRFHGGQDRLSNYQALCRQCNLAKGPTHQDYRQVAEPPGSPLRPPTALPAPPGDVQGWRQYAIDTITAWLLAHKPAASPEVALDKAVKKIDGTFMQMRQGTRNDWEVYPIIISTMGPCSRGSDCDICRDTRVATAAVWQAAQAAAKEQARESPQPLATAPVALAAPVGDVTGWRQYAVDTITDWQLAHNPKADPAEARREAATIVWNQRGHGRWTIYPAIAQSLKPCPRAGCQICRDYRVKTQAMLDALETATQHREKPPRSWLRKGR